MNNLTIIRNDKGQAVYLAGELPDGTMGIAADTARPFTEEELADADKFREHHADLARRVDAELVK